MIERNQPELEELVVPPRFIIESPVIAAVSAQVSAITIPELVRYDRIAERGRYLVIILDEATDVSFGPRLVLFKVNSFVKIDLDDGMS